MLKRRISSILAAIVAVILGVIVMPVVPTAGAEGAILTVKAIQVGDDGGIIENGLNRNVQFPSGNIDSAVFAQYIRGNLCRSAISGGETACLYKGAYVQGTEDIDLGEGKTGKRLLQVIKAEFSGTSDDDRVKLTTRPDESLPNQGNVELSLSVSEFVQRFQIQYLSSYDFYLVQYDVDPDMLVFEGPAIEPVEGEGNRLKQVVPIQYSEGSGKGVASIRIQHNRANSHEFVKNSSTEASVSIVERKRLDRSNVDYTIQTVEVSITGQATKPVNLDVSVSPLSSTMVTARTTGANTGYVESDANITWMKATRVSNGSTSENDEIGNVSMQPNSSVGTLQSIPRGQAVQIYLKSADNVETERGANYLLGSVNLNGETIGVPLPSGFTQTDVDFVNGASNETEERDRLKTIWKQMRVKNLGQPTGGSYPAKLYAQKTITDGVNAGTTVRVWLTNIRAGRAGRYDIGDKIDVWSGRDAYRDVYTPYNNVYSRLHPAAFLLRAVYRVEIIGLVNRENQVSFNYVSTANLLHSNMSSEGYESINSDGVAQEAVEVWSHMDRDNDATNPNWHVLCPGQIVEDRANPSGDNKAGLPCLYPKHANVNFQFSDEPNVNYMVVRTKFAPGYGLPKWSNDGKTLTCPGGVPIQNGTCYGNPEGSLPAVISWRSLGDKNTYVTGTLIDGNKLSKLSTVRKDRLNYDPNYLYYKVPVWKNAGSLELPKNGTNLSYVQKVGIEEVQPHWFLASPFTFRVTHKDAKGNSLKNLNGVDLQADRADTIYNTRDNYLFAASSEVPVLQDKRPFIGYQLMACDISGTCKKAVRKSKSSATGGYNVLPGEMLNLREWEIPWDTNLTTGAKDVGRQHVTELRLIPATEADNSSTQALRYAVQQDAQKGSGAIQRTPQFFFRAVEGIKAALTDTYKASTATVMVDGVSLNRVDSRSVYSAILTSDPQAVPTKTAEGSTQGGYLLQFYRDSPISVSVNTTWTINGQVVDGTPPTGYSTDVKFDGTSINEDPSTKVSTELTDRYAGDDPLVTQEISLPSPTCKVSSTIGKEGETADVLDNSNGTTIVLNDNDKWIVHNEVTDCATTLKLSVGVRDTLVNSADIDNLWTLSMKGSADQSSKTVSNGQVVNLTIPTGQLADTIAIDSVVKNDSAKNFALGDWECTNGTLDSQAGTVTVPLGANTECTRKSSVSELTMFEAVQNTGQPIALAAVTTVDGRLIVGTPESSELPTVNVPATLSGTDAEKLAAATTFAHDSTDYAISLADNGETKEVKVQKWAGSLETFSLENVNDPADSQNWSDVSDATITTATDTRTILRVSESPTFVHVEFQLPLTGGKAQDLFIFAGLAATALATALGALQWHRRRRVPITL